MSYLGQDHANFIRELIHGMRTAISREESFLKGSPPKQVIEFQEKTKPALMGSVLVTCIANVEFLIGKRAETKGFLWWKKTKYVWNLPKPYYGLQEFNNFRKLRHCFAHGGGRVLSNLNNDITKFKRKLDNSQIVDRENKIVKPYYEIKSNRIHPTNFDFFNRLESLCFEILVERGLLQRYYP